MKIVFNTPIIIVGLMVLASCNVKEDRTLSPCRLDISLDARSGIDSIPSTMRLIFWKGEITDPIQSECIDPPDTCPVNEWPAYRDSLSKGFVNADRHRPSGVCMMPISKSVVDVCSITGLDSDVIDGKYITIPKGQDADPLWMCSHFNIDCTDEESTDFVELHKQHCAIKMKIFYDEGADLSTYPVIKTDVYGLSMMDPERILRDESSFKAKSESDPNGPYDSAFEYSLKGKQRAEKEGNYDVYYFCLPRLSERSENIRLELYKGENDTFWNFRDIARTINRNNLIDWTERDLGDLEITMDITRVGCSFMIVAWEHVDLGTIRL